MRALHPITPADLPEVLLRVSLARPVHLWGAPGIGKTSMVESFAHDLGMDCVTLMATQLAPEDIAGVPQLVTRDDGITFSRFAPPEMLVRTDPFVLFLDELNGARPEVQKSLYSLVLTGRVGEYRLAAGSVVIAAGNRATDSAALKPMPAPLLNRFVHIHLRSSVDDWLAWAVRAQLNPLVVEYITHRPDHLHVEPPKSEEAFSSPRSWHALSDALTSWGDGPDVQTVAMLASGCVTATHAASFAAWYKMRARASDLESIIRGDLRWPVDVADRDLLHFLALSFRARLSKDLPADVRHASQGAKQFAIRAKDLLIELADVSLEIAQIVVAPDESGTSVLPAWFLAELVRDVPRLASQRSS
ncbi:ATP-binding protein [Cnuibacter sp. UC19_7]|uniref:ATP-binding protein n=1 Tax=Cnuibacter sp. UC19_7 TaxID=3350166 RepID=UPI00366BEAC8